MSSSGDVLTAFLRALLTELSAEYSNGFAMQTAKGRQRLAEDKRMAIN